jgi:hypothetical protein|tara:strand:+ start:44 stop:292 length:249 start_codon:yes stop_codon:yes gene_type:complete
VHFFQLNGFFFVWFLSQTVLAGDYECIANSGKDNSNPPHALGCNARRNLISVNSLIFSGGTIRIASAWSALAAMVGKIFLGH